MSHNIRSHAVLLLTLLMTAGSAAAQYHGGHFSGVPAGGGFSGHAGVSPAGTPHIGFYQGGYHSGYAPVYHPSYNRDYLLYTRPFVYGFPFVWMGPTQRPPINGAGHEVPYEDLTESYPEDSTAVQPPSTIDPAFDLELSDSAHLTITLPADAKLWLDSTLMTATGPVREFDSPLLKPGNRYTYDIKATWNDNGREVTQTQQVPVRAGGRVEVKFPVAGSRG